MNKNKNTKKYFAGFTLIEVMVSVAIFTIIMTVGVGALVDITNKYKLSQQQKTVADSMNFLLESMTREIRLGTEYYPGSENSAHVGSSRNTQVGQDDSIKVKLANPSVLRGEYVSYYLNTSANDGLVNMYRFDSSGSLISQSTLNDASAIYIEELSFTVLGTAPGTADYQQPLVWIRMKARPGGNSELSSISLQSLVSQRTLDF